MEEYLEFAKDIAYNAGKIIMKYFNSSNGASYKGDKTIVTLADKEINSYLISRVKEKFPEHSVDGEEEQFGKSDYVWVCDPVDGTAMYARHIPVAVFSLGLVINGESQLGVVYDVFTDSLYTAIKGKGAYKNNEKILLVSQKMCELKRKDNKEVDEEDKKVKLARLYNVLIENKDIKEYFDNEIAFNKLMYDVNKIIGDAIKDIM